MRYVQEFNGPDKGNEPAFPVNMAGRLFGLAIEAGADLFSNPAGDTFLTITVGNHVETWPIRSRAAESWLVELYSAQEGRIPSKDALRSTVDLLVARARFKSGERPMGLRLGEHAERLYLDLCDAQWQAVEIEPDGWRVITNPPIRFQRAPGMLPLPAPERGGSIDALRRYVNVGSGNRDREDHEFVLAVAWLLAAFRPRGPYPVLALTGEQGSAKSSFASVLRRLVDPNSSDLRSPPRDNRDLFITAGNSHAIVFDNLSELSAPMSDSLCRLASGGGFATRRLRTDRDEVLFHATRPIILNGIEDCITRPDLAERTIFLRLSAVPEYSRREEQELWTEFKAERPRILGALLDAVAYGMKQLPTTKPPRLPRMADFVRWVTACEGAFWVPGTFMAAYGANRDAAAKAMIEADAVATAVRALMATRAEWAGSPIDLLSNLNALSPQLRKGDRKWPGDGRALINRLRRITPGLRHFGITLTHAANVVAIENRGTIGSTFRNEAFISTAAATNAYNEPRNQSCRSRAEDVVKTLSTDCFLHPSDRKVRTEPDPAVQITLPDGARISISASTPPKLAAAIVTAVSRLPTLVY